MYEGLRESLRAATLVKTYRFDDPTTYEIIYVAERHGQTLIRFRISKEVLLSFRYPDMAIQDFRIKVQGIIDQILDDVNWNTFF